MEKYRGYLMNSLSIIVKLCGKPNFAQYSRQLIVLTVEARTITEKRKTVFTLNVKKLDNCRMLDN